MPVSDTLLLRSEKAAPLTNAEVDNNFSVLRDFSDALEARVDASLNEDGSLVSPLVVGGTSATGSDAYVTALDGFTPSTEADLVGKVILLKPTDFGNTTAATLIVSPLLTARAIVRPGGVALNKGDIIVNQPAVLIFDATNTKFVLLNPATNLRANHYADSGSVNALVVATSPSPPFAEPVAYYAGYSLRVKVTNTNTGATTLKVGDLAAVAVVRGSSTALSGGELVAGQIYDFVHDGTSFQLLTERGVLTFTSSDLTLVRNTVLVSAAAHSLGAAPKVMQVFLVSKANNGASGYAVGDIIPAWCAYGTDDQSAVRPFPTISVTASATTYTVCCGLDNDYYGIQKKDSSGHVFVSRANFILDWNVRVVLTR